VKEEQEREKVEREKWGKRMEDVFRKL